MTGPEIRTICLSTFLYVFVSVRLCLSICQQNNNCIRVETTTVCIYDISIWYTSHVQNRSINEVSKALRMRMNLPQTYETIVWLAGKTYCFWDGFCILTWSANNVAAIDCRHVLNNRKVILTKKNYHYSTNNV